MTEKQIALSEFIAVLMGWERQPENHEYAGFWHRPDRPYAAMSHFPPKYATSWSLMEELVTWLNERGYLAVIKQLPRGQGFLLDEMTGQRTDPDFPSLVELEPVYEFMGREFRTMPRVSAESMDIDIPFDRYSFRPGFCCKTVPEAMCKVIQSLADRFPELRESVSKEG